MAVAFVKNHTVASNKTAGTTLALALDSIVPAGSLIVCRMVYDNAATASKPLITSIARAAGETNTWTSLGYALSTSTSAGAFAQGAMQVIETTVAWPAGSYTVTLDTSTTQKAGFFQEFIGTLATQRSTAGTAYSTTTTQASATTTGTTPVIGDLVLGFMFNSNAATAMSGDNDTVGGSWSAVAGVGSTGGNVATNNFGGGVYKILTAASHQTLNNSALLNAGNGAIVAVLQAAPPPVLTQASYQFFDDLGTEAAAVALGAQNTDITGNINNGDGLGMLRVRVQNTGAINGRATDSYRLQWEKNASGTWADVTTGLVAAVTDSFTTAFTTSEALVTGGSSAAGQSFTGTGGKLTRVDMWVSKGGSPPGNIFVEIYAHSGVFGTSSVPTGSPLATSTVRAATSIQAAPGGWETFTFDSTFTLTAGTPYVLVANVSSLGTSPNLIQIHRVGGGSHSGNGSWRSAGGVWTAYASDTLFQVYELGVAAVTGYDAPSLTEGGATTSRLTGGSGTFVPGKIAEDGHADNLGVTAGNFTELVYALKLPAAKYVHGDSVRFRVVHNDSSAPFTYSVYPTINVINVAPAVNPAAYRFYADGTETGSTALAVQDTASTVDVSSVDVNMQVRMRLQSTSVAPIPSTDDWQLQWEKNASGAWANVASGEFIADSYTTTAGGAPTAIDAAATGTSAMAQSFRGNGCKLTGVDFWMNKTGTPPGNLVARLYTHTGTFGGNGMATGAPLATSTPVVASTVSTSLGWQRFTFDGSFTLEGNTPYVIAMWTETTTTSANCVNVYAVFTAPSHPGSKCVYANAAPGWLSGSGEDVPFRLYTSPTAVIPYNSSNLTDGAATTNRLGAGTGSFVPGKVSEDGLVDNLGWTANDYTEVLYPVTLKQADLTNGDTVRFRILRNGAPLDVGAISSQYDESNQSSWGTIGQTGIYAVQAQSFMGDGLSLTKAGFYMYKVNSPTGSVTAELYAHTGTFGAGGLATGSPLAVSSPIDASTFGTTLAWTDFTFASPVLLESGTPYVIGVRYEVGNSSNYLNAGIDTSSSTAPGNRVLYSTSWLSSTSDLIYRVYTSSSVVPTINVTKTPVAVTQAAYRFYDDSVTPTLTIGYPLINGDSNASLSPTQPSYAESFVGNGEPLVRVGWYLKRKVGGPAIGTATARLYASTTPGEPSTGTPTGTALAVSSTVLDLATLTEVTGAWFYFDFPVTPLNNGTAYFITIDTSDTSAVTTNQATLYYDQSAPSYPGRFMYYNTTVWTTGTTGDAVFEIYTGASESSSTALAALNTAPAVDIASGDVNLQLRARLQSTTVAPVPVTDDWQLQWERNANGTWTNVEIYSSAPTVASYNSPNLTDGAATTNRLGAGTGSFVAGKVSEDGLVDDLGWTANNYTEVLYSLTVKPSGAVVLADSYPSSNRDNGVAMQAAGGSAGQSFLGTGEVLTRAGFFLVKSGAPVTTVTAYLYAHTGTFGSTGMATGPPLATSTTTVPSSSLGTGLAYAMYYFDFDGTFLLQSGTPYVIACGITAGLGGADIVAAGSDSSTSTHAGLASTFNGTAWNATAAWDLIFEVYTKPPGVELGDTLRFRILRNGTTDGLTYTQTPTVTIGTAVGPGPKALDGSSSGQSTATGTRLDRAVPMTAVTPAGVSTAAATRILARIVVLGLGTADGVSAAAGTRTDVARAFIGTTAGVATDTATTVIIARALAGNTVGFSTTIADLTSTGAVITVIGKWGTQDVIGMQWGTQAVIGSMVGGAAVIGTAPATITIPTLVGTASVFPAAETTATATTIAIPTPADAAIGEGLLACITSSGSTATDLTLPDGWSRIGLPAVLDAGVRILGWFFMPISATPAGSYSFTSPIAGRFGGIMWRVQNAHPTQPHKSGHAYGGRNAAVIDVYPFNNTAGNTPTEDCLHLVCAGGQVTAGQSAAISAGPALFTLTASAVFGLSAGSRTYLHVWQKDLVAGMQTTTTTITMVTNPASAASNGILIRGR